MALLADRPQQQAHLAFGAPRDTGEVVEDYVSAFDDSIVGVTGPTYDHAMLWTRKEGMQHIGTVDRPSYANDINDSGVVKSSSGLNA